MTEARFNAEVLFEEFTILLNSYDKEELDCLRKKDFESAREVRNHKKAVQDIILCFAKSTRAQIQPETEDKQWKI